MVEKDLHWPRPDADMLQYVNRVVMNMVKEITTEVRGLSKYTSDAGIVIVIIRFSALPTVTDAARRRKFN